MLRVVILAICVAASACAPTRPPPPTYLLAVGDPRRRAPALRVGDATAGTRDFRPVGPRDWIDVNRDIAPPPKETPR